MKAVLCKVHGPADLLAVEDIAAPVAGPGEAVVEVAAVGLNFFDTLIIENKYQFKPELPFSPGAEIAGTVVELGPEVAGVARGDRVMAYIGWGGCRERVAVAAGRLARIPDAVPFEVAAGLTVTYGTAIHALKDRAHLAAGETLAVLGASGGVGQAAIEIGKALGARVIACASSDDKLAFCRELGADEVVNYGSGDLRQALKDLTGGRGVDVIYDPVGGELAEAALRAIAWNGRFLVIGFAGGIPRLALNLVLLKGCQVVGVFWGEHLAREPERHRANMGQLAEWLTAGAIRPHVWRTFPLEQTADALAALARREVLGKAVVTP